MLVTYKNKLSPPLFLHIIMFRVIFIDFIVSCLKKTKSAWTEISAQHFENAAGGISLQHKIFLPSGNVLL